MPTFQREPGNTVLIVNERIKFLYCELCLVCLAFAEENRFQLSLLKHFDGSLEEELLMLVRDCGFEKRGV